MGEINKKYIENKKQQKSFIRNKKSKLNSYFTSISKFGLAVALFFLLAFIVNAKDVVVESGKIGVGTETIEQPLDVIGNIEAQSNNEVFLNLKNTETGGREYTLVSAGSAGGIGVGKFSIYDRTGGQSRLTIDANGNVGIGTTEPMGDINGGPAPKMQVESNFAGGGPTIVVENQNPAGDAAIDFRSGNRELKGNIAYVISDANPRFIVNQGFWGLNTVLNEAGGNVGIGTTSPGTKLAIAGTGSANGITLGSDQAAPATLYHSGGDTLQLASGDFFLADRVYAGIIRSKIDGGRPNIELAGGGMSLVPILATAGAQLQDSPKIEFNTEYWDGTLLQSFRDIANIYVKAVSNTPTGTSTSRMEFQIPGASTKMVIQSSGNVGIGTTSPAAGYRLDVEGKIQATTFDTGDITFSDQKTQQILWRMFEDENGLYLESAKTGKVYRFVLEET